MADLKMPDFNRVHIAGRLTRDPELTYLQNGTPLCKMGIAVSRFYKTKDGERKEETLFINVTAWSKLAEWCGENCHKGSPVIIEGRLKSDEWEDKNTGQKRTKIEIVADRVQGLEWRDRDGGGGASSRSEHPEPRKIEEPIPEDDIPF